MEQGMHMRPCISVQRMLLHRRAQAPLRMETKGRHPEESR